MSQENDQMHTLPQDGMPNTRRPAIILQWTSVALFALCMILRSQSSGTGNNPAILATALIIYLSAMMGKRGSYHLVFGLISLMASAYLLLTSILTT